MLKGGNPQVEEATVKPTAVDREFEDLKQSLRETDTFEKKSSFNVRESKRLSTGTSGSND